MDYASNYYHYPANDFVKPDDVNTGTVSASTGLLPRPGERTVTDWFIDGTMPTIYGGYYNAPPCKADCNPPCYGDNCDNPPTNNVPPTDSGPPVPDGNTNGN